MLQPFPNVSGTLILPFARVYELPCSPHLCVARFLVPDEHLNVSLTCALLGLLMEVMVKGMLLLQGAVLLAVLALLPNSADAQLTAKIVAQTAAPKAKAPKAPKEEVTKAPPSENIACQSNGNAGQQFLLATAYGGSAPYTLNQTVDKAFVTAADGTASPVPTPTGITFNASDDPSKNSLFATIPLGVAAKTQIQISVNGKDSKGVTLPTTPCVVTVGAPPAPGAIFVGCPGPGYVGAAFPIANVSGGTPPYKYTVSLPESAVVPAQLVPDATTGVVAGMSSPGIQPNLTIKVTDSNQVPGQSTCTITVQPQPEKWGICALFPVAHESCMGSGLARNANVNSFWQTDGSFVFFNQVKAIYNEASNSETISADMGTLNFPIGMQLNIGTNIQAGATAPTPVSTGTVPTLSPTAAAQAAQNLLYGGTIYASSAYPLLALGGNRISSPGGWGGMLDVAGREGVDIQSFKSGTSTGATSPATHSSLQLEGYAQMNSSNVPTPGGGTITGALFAGGSYGYSYTAHQYIRDYGIKNASNRLGQVSGGIVLSGVATLAFSRAFGPVQTYYDGTVTPTPTTTTTVNNFKSWCFQLTYQSPAPGTK